MAKKDVKKKKGAAKKDGKGPADTVRAAVERTFQATAGSATTTRERAQDLAEELTALAARVRESVDVRERIEGLRAEVEALSARVADLEAAAKPAAAKRSAPRGSAAPKGSTGQTRSRAKATATADKASPGRS